MVLLHARSAKQHDAGAPGCVSQAQPLKSLAAEPEPCFMAENDIELHLSTWWPSSISWRAR